MLESLTRLCNTCDISKNEEKIQKILTMESLTTNTKESHEEINEVNVLELYVQELKKLRIYEYLRDLKSRYQLTNSEMISIIRCYITYERNCDVTILNKESD